MTSVITDPLAELGEVAQLLGADDVLRDASSVAARVAEGLFYVACVGQFKRGKSTLINALLGEDLLPTGVIPVTAVITVVRYGAAPRAIVRFLDGAERAVERQAIADYIAEDRNPGNRKNVQVLEIEMPTPLLESGMCLVDTPGLGSVFETNSETTRQFVPHIDAALIVLGADPPISGEEAAVVEQIAQQVPDLLFVLNKADRLSATDVEQAAAFCRRILDARLGRGIEIFTLSALQPSTRDFPKLEARLAGLARESGADLVRSAEARALQRLGARVMHEIDERRAALLRPVEENQQRLQTLQRGVDEAQRSLRDLSFLFMAEERDLNVRFAAERDRFLENVTAGAVDELRREVRAADVRATALRDFAMRAAQRIAEQRVRTWLVEIEPRAERMYAKAVERFIALSRDFVGQFGDVAERIDFDQTFRTRRRFFFTTLSALTGRLPGASVVDVFRTRSSFLAKTLRDGEMFLRRLLNANSARVANDLTDRVLESRRRLESEIRRQLQNLVAAATRAAERARAMQESGADRVKGELDDLDRIATRVAEACR